MSQHKNQIQTFYSIWLRPTTASAEKIQIVIDELAEKYKSPRFDCHLTILAGMSLESNEISQVQDKLADSVQLMSPFKIKSLALTQLNEKYRALFMEFANEGEILNLRNWACESFTYNESRHFVPHISLIYAYLDNKVKINIKDTLRERLPAEVTFDRMELREYSETADFWRPMGAPCLFTGNHDP